MKKSLHILACLSLILGVWACEQPESPDFQLNHELEAPLSLEKTYPFLGGEDALVDTASEDLENLFSPDPDGLVHIVQEEDFNFGDLDDAIPEVDADPTTIEVTGTAGSQTMSAQGMLQIVQNSFKFRKPAHFVELDTGSLTIDISSSLNVTVDIFFHDVEDESGEELVISDIGVSENESYSESFDLTRHRIKAYQGELNFTIEASTKGESVTKSDALDVTLDLKNLVTSMADGYIVPKHVMLNDDQTNDFQDNVDVFNDDEAEISDLDGISELSDRVSNLTFENPILSTLYNTNLGVNTTVYAVIAGTDNKGNIEYLTGLEGSEYQVGGDEIPEQLVVNGRRATSEQVIKFPVEAVENPDPDEGEFGGNEFNSSNTNSPDFFSNLPTKIRFVGVAEINTQEEEGEIVNPVIFDPQLGLDLPMSLSADSATFSDSLEADLGDLPKEGEDQTLTEAILTINYTNRLPINLDLTLIMLDEDGNEVTRKEDVTITGAGVNSDGYVDENKVSENALEISFSEEELKTLHRTRDIELNAELNTPDLQTVRIRKDDSITLHIKMKAGITSTVN